MPGAAAAAVAAMSAEYPQVDRHLDVLAHTGALDDATGRVQFDCVALAVLEGDSEGLKPLILRDR
jgi:hypothetical protein